MIIFKICMIYQNKIIEDIINKKRNEMIYFINELSENNFPKEANDENQFRILSFPWFISGNILSNFKM